MRKNLVMVLLSCVVAGNIGGCSLPFGGSVTPEELIDGMYSEDNADKVDAEIDFVFTSKVSQGDVSANITIKMGVDLQSDGKAGYLEGKATVETLGVSSNQDIESYYDYEEGVQYTNVDGKWVYDKVKASGSVMSLESDDFDDLEMEKKDGRGWTVKGKVGYDAIAEMLGMSESLEGIGLGSADTLSKVDMDAELTYAKDKSIESIKFSVDPDEVEDVDLEKFSIGVEYNELDKDFSVEIPKDVIRGAVEKSEVGSIDTKEGTSNMDNTSEGQADVPATLEEPIIKDTDSGDTEEPSLNEPAKVPASASNGCTVSYDGEELTYATLTSKGWVADSEPGIFVSFRNESYPDATLYGYGAYDEVTPEELETSGILGYDIDVTYCEGSLPGISFGEGITWGCSRGDIEAVYGSPVNVDDYGKYVVMNYSTEDGTDIEFVIYSENEFGITGLTRVSSVNYGAMQSK